MHLAGHKVVVVDFGRLCLGPLSDEATRMDDQVTLADRYEHNQYLCWKRGLIAVGNSEKAPRYKLECKSSPKHT